ncbi:MAG: carboxymuconolactone decarboxylase family protein [Burkholderiaceae bacterium]|nr:carboxymuconolactone decarboxylase family protein [Burkholderiaceae bacterium]
MARIPMLEAKDLGPQDQELLVRNLTSWRVLAHSPNGLRIWGQMIGFFLKQSRLDARLREFALLQIGWLSQEPYEWSHHVKISLDIGISEAQIDQLIAYNRGQPNALDARYLLVMRAATEFFEKPALSQAMVQELQTVMNLESLSDFVLLLAFYTGMVRLFASLEVDVEPEYMRFLDRFALTGNGGKKE